MNSLLLFFEAHWTWLMPTIGLLAWAVWMFQDNEDLRDHRGKVAWGLVLVGFGYGAGWFMEWLLGLGPIGGALKWIGAGLGLWFLGRYLDRAINECSGGFMFDVMMSEGKFAQAPVDPAAMPKLVLLRHWRDSGLAFKAYNTAVKHLCDQPDSYALWLFAAETAALWQSNLPAAEKIMRKLCMCATITEDQKLMALDMFNTWASTQGYRLSLPRFKGGGSGLQLSNPAAQATQLRQQGKAKEAVRMLERAVKTSPDDLASTLLLARIHAEDLGQPDRARQVIEKASSEPFVPKAFIEFATRSVREWSTAKPQSPKGSWLDRWFGKKRPSNRIQLLSASAQDKPAPIRLASGVARGENPSTHRVTVPHPPASISKPDDTAGTLIDFNPGEPNSWDLLQTGHVGTAIERMEQYVAQFPYDYQAVMELAEMHIKVCDNLHRAEELVRRIEGCQNFTAPQKASARERLRGWTIQCLNRRKPAGSIT